MEKLYVQRFLLNIMDRNYLIVNIKGLVITVVSSAYCFSTLAAQENHLGNFIYLGLLSEQLNQNLWGETWACMLFKLSKWNYGRVF